MTDLIKRDDALEPCPFCGGAASDTGFMEWSKALPDTHWDDGSEITKAYFCNCTSCSVTNIVCNVGYRTKAEAIAAWNTRSADRANADRIEDLEARNKELTLQLLAAHGQAADALDRAVVAEAKLAKAVERLKTMADYNKYVIAPFLAELEKKE